MLSCDSVCSGGNTELLATLFGNEDKELGAEEDFTNCAVLASSAANVERTEVMIYWEELEAASMSATSAAILLVDFLVLCPDFAVGLFDGQTLEFFESPT